MPDLKIETVDIDSVFQDTSNARVHSEDQLNYIAKSLERFGQQKPIVVDKENIIVAGNGTHAAAKHILDWKTIAVVFTELPLEEARAFAIADNQIATQSEWNLDVLSQHIQDLAEWNPMQDWQSIGFEQDFIDPITGDDEVSDVSDLSGGDEEQEEKPSMGKPFKVTEEQREFIDQAINVVRLSEEDYTMSDGRALELIAADFLSQYQPVKSEQDQQLEQTQEIE